MELLRGLGHKVYDFRDSGGFHWSEVDPSIEVQGFADYGTRAENMDILLNAPPARRGFARDMAAIRTADTLVLVLPCGRSAHLELGLAIGLGKKTVVLLDDPCQPELMYKAVDYVAANMHQLCNAIGKA